MNANVFDSPWQDLLLELLQIDTQSPLETGQLSHIPDAQQLIARHACQRGFKSIHLGAPRLSDLHADLVPLNVIEAVITMGSAFIESQPSLVLRAGREQSMDRTILFNFHIDTVAGTWTPSFVDGRFSGRGAIDAKGPGMAVLAGISRAITEEPALLDHIQILVQSVSGEEGGAMGVYGTRALINQGFIGRLNVFAEPSGNVYFDSATSTMTARIEVAGEGSTDDAPATGHNATIILAFICRQMASDLAWFFQENRRMCVGGLHTGTAHNRVYGSGVLQLNFAYPDRKTALEIQALVDLSFRRALFEFGKQFSSIPLFARSATDTAAITSLTWTKKGLPALANRDAAMEQLLAENDIRRCPADRVNEAFTCDAIWAQRPDSYAIVFGPGDLAANHAHADGEFVMLADLESYAAKVASLVRSFARVQQRHEQAALVMEGRL